MRFKQIKFAILIACLPGFATAQELAQEFSAPKITGNEEVKLSDYRGKVVFLDFWASWCPPCLVSLPAYDKMYRELDSEEFEIIAINVDENTEDGLEFLEDHPVSYLMLADPDGKVGIPYGIRSLPVSYLIDREGRIVQRYRSYKIGDEIPLKKLIEDVLNE
ncbi:MAG: TlpA disulfide reductase family protein [Pseudohongiellaceae bacterium]